MWFMWFMLFCRVAAGDGFSVFASDSGAVLTCGDGAAGCLGHGDYSHCVRPRLVGKALHWRTGGHEAGQGIDRAGYLPHALFKRRCAEAFWHVVRERYSGRNTRVILRSR